MLPGFRFLFAAIVLSVSILTFGLGAAALLRAAHEEFASIPTRRVTPEPYFAQPAEAPTPTLAMLRVEPALQDTAATSAPALALAEEPAPEAVPVPKVDAEKLAVLTADVAPPVEPAKADVAKAEVTATEPPVATPSTEETPAETKTAVLDAQPPPQPVIENAPPPSELIVMPAMTDDSVPVAADKPKAKIAALGSPAAAVEPQVDAKKSSAKADRAELRKKQRAERAKERRRLAARRARLAAQQAAAQPTATVQQSAEPFGATPAQTPAPRRRR